MKKIFTLFAICAFMPSMAQINVEEQQITKEEATFAPEVKQQAVDAEYTNQAKLKAERAAIRKERNYIEFGASLQGTLTNYNNAWQDVTGGSNTIAAVASFNFTHTFAKGLFSIENKVTGKIGYDRMKATFEPADGGKPYDKGAWFKNQDEFMIYTAPAFKMVKNWTYGATVRFRSQFANGFTDRTHTDRKNHISSFMAPGYLDASLGFTYVCPVKAFPIKINISPIAMNATFVENSHVLKVKNYGVDDAAGKRSRWEGGSSIQIDFDKTFDKKGIFRYRTTLYSFYGWITDITMTNRYSNYSAYAKENSAWKSWEKYEKNPNEIPMPDVAKPANKPNLGKLPVHPVVRWENTFDIKATKYLTTQIYFQLYYNRAQDLRVQTQTLLSVGLAYTFKSK